MYNNVGFVEQKKRQPQELIQMVHIYVYGVPISRRNEHKFCVNLLASFNEAKRGSSLCQKHYLLLWFDIVPHFLFVIQLFEGRIILSPYPYIYIYILNRWPEIIHKKGCTFPSGRNLRSIDSTAFPQSM